MDIYTDSGELDLDAARREATRLESARDEKAARTRAQALTIAALLDIAESLRPLAAEVLATYGDGIVSGSAEESVLDEREPLKVGDIVRVDGFDALGEIVDFRYTEGELFAEVRFVENADDDDEVIGTLALDKLHRLVGDEAPHISTPEEDAAMIDADDAPELFADEPGEVTLMDGTEPPKDGNGYPILSELADDIDDDFDGDSRTEAEDAVAKLAEAEAKRKAEKKAKKK